MTPGKRVLISKLVSEWFRIKELRFLIAIHLEDVEAKIAIYSFVEKFINDNINSQAAASTPTD